MSTALRFETYLDIRQPCCRMYSCRSLLQTSCTCLICTAVCQSHQLSLRCGNHMVCWVSDLHDNRLKQSEHSSRTTAAAVQVMLLLLTDSCRV